MITSEDDDLNSSKSRTENKKKTKISSKNGSIQFSVVNLAQSAVNINGKINSVDVITS
jgi:hypothetical protein